MKFNLAILTFAAAASAKYVGPLFAIQDDDCPELTSKYFAENVQFNGNDECVDVDHYCAERERCNIGFTMNWISDAKWPVGKVLRCSDDSCNDCDDEEFETGAEAGSTDVFFNCVKMEGKQYMKWVAATG